MCFVFISDDDKRFLSIYNCSCYIVFSRLGKRKIYQNINSRFFRRFKIPHTGFLTKHFRFSKGFPNLNSCVSILTLSLFSYFRRFKGNRLVCQSNQHLNRRGLIREGLRLLKHRLKQNHILPISGFRDNGSTPNLKIEW